MPIRTLARECKLSAGEVCGRIREEMNSLPTNEWLSQIYCNRWSGILNLDGVYVKVKGFKEAIPFIYGIDFETHDIPCGLLAPSENQEAFLHIFRLLKAIHYPLKVVVCDEAPAIKPALSRVFPDAKIQFCHNHYLENVRNLLRIRSMPSYRPFFEELRRLFHNNNLGFDYANEIRRLYAKYSSDQMAAAVLHDIFTMRENLFCYLTLRKQGMLCPATNNLIEAYNSHLKGRLKSIKGFESFASAERWLNAWILRRRFKPFSACGEPFKHLNGHCSFKMSKRMNAPWPEIFGISPTEKPTRK